MTEKSCPKCGNKMEKISEGKGLVHETWFAPSLYRSTVHLTKEYYYEHRKSVMKIYRNAARNFFIGGSGDNLGDLNPTYVELHRITQKLGIDTWQQFEETMKEGNAPQELIEFLVNHRSDSKYSYESEVRETFKWYFEMHPEENTGDWKSEYTAPPEGSREDIENYVIETYFSVLGRAPDDIGKIHYVNAILNKEIPKEALPTIFINSDEYKTKFISHLKDGIALCIMGYHDALPMIKESIKTCESYIKEIHVQGDNFTQEDIDALTAIGAEVHIEEWRDEFSEYKNKVIGYAHTKWVLVCYDEITEVLTIDGFKRFSNISQEDEIATLNPETGYLEYQHPSAIHCYDYSGKMLKLEGKHYDLLVTPGHQIYARPRKENIQEGLSGFKLIRADKLAEYNGFELKKDAKWEGIDKQIIEDIPNNLFMDLLGWYISEGCTQTQKFRNKIIIYQSKEENRQEIKSLIYKLGRSSIPSKSNTGIIFYHKALFDFVNPLGLSYEKYIPNEIKALPTNLLERFVTTYLKGDGNGDNCATTTSKRLADDLQEIFLKCGYSSSIKENEPVEGGINERGVRIRGARPIYVISINKEELTPEVRKEKATAYLEETCYTGKVYDVTVPNHIIFVRRNGKVLFSGNCDHDEIPTPEMAQHLKELIEKSEKGNSYNMVSFTALNQTVDSAGKIIAECSGNGKALLHFNIKDPYYGNPHIWLKPNYFPWVELRVPYAYRHVKEEGVDITRAIRNVFLGGGGDNFRDKNPMWPELRQITNRLGLVTYVDFLEYLKQPNADPKLKEWMEKAYEFPWHDNELRCFKDYYYKLHPEETR